VIKQNAGGKGMKKYNKGVSSSELIKVLCYFSGFYEEVIREYTAKKFGKKLLYRHVRQVINKNIMLLFCIL